MSEILSQDEVNALLQGVQEGTVPTGSDAGEGPPGVRGLDLTSQERSLRGRLPALEQVMDRLVRGMRSALGTFFGQLPVVGVSALELIKHGTIMKGLPSPVSLQLFRLTPLRGQGMMIVTPPVVATLLQISFGGNRGKKAPPPSREFSSIELRLIERLSTATLHELQEAWRPIESIDFKLVRGESNPLFVNIASPQELMLLIELQVELEGLEPLKLAVCIPNASLDPVRHRLQASLDQAGETPQGGWGETLRAVVAEAALEVSAELGVRWMSLRDVIGLKVGDVVSLPTGREGPVVVCVEGRPRFHAVPGVSHGNNALRVIGRI
jgi:flagellar motor switch protein FliM